MTKTLHSLTGDAPRPVNIAELEAELSALWRSAAEDPETHHPVTRACALTLLVYVENEQVARQATNLIAEVTHQNPCRAVVMIAESGAEPAGLEAEISAHCHLPAPGEKQVCCEQISLWARGDAVQDLDKAVLPLTVPGLPVFLWWRAGRFLPAKHFDQILRVSNRVLVDSADFPDPEADLAGLAEYIQRFSDEPVLSDLNWTRITPWRELMAQCFDSLETRVYLDRLSQVRIEYEERSPRVVAHRAQSLLLTGWLASRLNWEPVRERTEREGASRSFFFRSGGRWIRVQSVPRRFEGGGAGHCVSIFMKAGEDSPATFSLIRGADGKTAITRREIAGGAPVERTVRREVLNDVELVNEEIKFAGRDRVFEEALRMVAQLVGPASSLS